MRICILPSYALMLAGLLTWNVAAVMAGGIVYWVMAVLRDSVGRYDDPGERRVHIGLDSLMLAVCMVLLLAAAP